MCTGEYHACSCGQIHWKNVYLFETDYILCFINTIEFLGHQNTSIMAERLHILF